MGMVEDLGIESEKSGALVEGTGRGEDVVHAERNEPSVPEAHLIGVIEDGPRQEVVGLANVLVGVVSKAVAAPKSMESAVIGAAAVAGMNADLGLDIDGPVETVAGTGTAGSHASGAPGSIMVIVFPKPLGDVGNKLYERGALFEAAASVMARGLAPEDVRGLSLDKLKEGETSVRGVPEHNLLATIGGRPPLGGADGVPTEGEGGVDGTSEGASYKVRPIFGGAGGKLSEGAEPRRVDIFTAVRVGVLPEVVPPSDLVDGGPDSRIEDRGSDKGGQRPGTGKVGI